MLRTIGFALGLVLMVVMDGCFLSADRRVEMTRAAERPTLEAAATALVQANTFATQEANSQATTEAIRESGELNQLVVGRWTGIEMGALDYILIEFYPDSTYEARVDALQAERAHLKKKIIRGTYQLMSTDKIKMNDDVFGEVTYQLSFPDEVFEKEGVVFHRIELKGEKGRELLTRCEGKYSDPQGPNKVIWCIEGVEYNPEGSLSALIESGNLQPLIIGNWTFRRSEGFPPGTPHDYGYLEFYPDGTYAGRPSAFYVSEEHLRNKIVRGTYEILNKNQLKLIGDIYGEQVFQVSFSEQFVSAVGETWKHMQIGYQVEERRTLTEFVKCEGALINHPERPDVFCVHGLTYQR